MIPRILEPEVMDTAEEAMDYNAMDHSMVNRVFVDDFLDVLRPKISGDKPSELVSPLSILDVGTGTAQIPIELCGRANDFRVTAIDLAAEMQKLALVNINKAGLSDVITTELVDAKALPYNNDTFDAVISNSIIHHIPNPQESFSEMLRVLRSGGILFVRDLLRPGNLTTLETIVSTYAGRENMHQQKMFRDSLHAALTLGEVRQLLENLGCPPECASRTSDRHWTVIKA